MSIIVGLAQAAGGNQYYGRGNTGGRGNAEDGQHQHLQALAELHVCELLWVTGHEEVIDCNEDDDSTGEQYEKDYSVD